MASLEGAKVRVSVESVVHEVLARAVQQIEAAHGIRVNSVAVEWADVSHVRERRAQVASVRVEATSFPNITA